MDNESIIVCWLSLFLCAVIVNNPYGSIMRSVCFAFMAVLNLLFLLVLYVRFLLSFMRFEIFGKSLKLTLARNFFIRPFLAKSVLRKIYFESLCTSVQSKLKASQKNKLNMSVASLDQSLPSNRIKEGLMKPQSNSGSQSEKFKHLKKFDLNNEQL